MPIILQSEDTPVLNQGQGWQEIELATNATFGEGIKAMVVKRWLFEPHAQGPYRTHGDSEQLLYVICGSGQAVVNGQTFELDDEAVLWLEPGEQYQFIAGSNGLEILQGYTSL